VATIATFVRGLPRTTRTVSAGQHTHKASVATCELEAEGERRRGRGRQIPRRRARRPGRAHRHAVMASSPKQETAHRKQETARRKELWREFAQQPGTHLRWELAGGLRRAELRTAEQQTIASVRGTIGPGLDGLVTVTTGGRSFTGKKFWTSEIRARGRRASPSSSAIRRAKSSPRPFGGASNH